ncbi:MAG TPA: CopG family antitoxin [bacterium]|nr:CopG family antitoxin [bacterium]
MKGRNKLKTIPLFPSEAEEAAFWNSADSTAYFPAKGGVRLKMPRRTTTISLRLPLRLLGRLKRLADVKDVPYQSLLKIYLDEKVRDEIRSLQKIA